MLPPESGIEPQAASVSIFAVIVLYKMLPSESPSYRTLLSAFARMPKNHLRLQVLLYDNTPNSSYPLGLPDFVLYQPSPINRGLATPYNIALERAAQGNFAWLLTLDQDTTLPDTFFEQLAPIAREQQALLQVAAIVPHISSGTRTLSPHSLLGQVKPRWFPKGFYGIPNEAVYAINSGALLRVAALQQVHGYNRLFWLDGSDLFLFRRLELAGKKVLVAGTISLEHDLSLNDVGNKMSLSRFGSALAAGSAFYDIQFGKAAGFGHTLLLVHLYLRQLRNKQNSGGRQLTLSLIRTRLFQSRTRRMRAWLASEEQRIISWQTPNEIRLLSPEISTQTKEALSPPLQRVQPVSILAVVVLYQTSPESSLTLRTLNAAAARMSLDSFRFKILVYDNTPGSHATPASRPGTIYVASNRNTGVSEAYNRAIQLADAEQFDWVLTLDQDTELSLDFLEKVVDIIRQVSNQSLVAAILPLIKESDRVLSPHWFRLDFFPRVFSISTRGIQSESVYGFNSGAILRTSALQNIGGYNPLFWLDYSDAYLFRMLHLFGYKAFVAGQIVIQHHLSLLHVEEMSETRYRNIVQAGSAFCDLYRNPFVRLQFTCKLLRSYIGQLRKPNSETKRQILGEAIRSRIFKSRSNRVREWVRQETDRCGPYAPPNEPTRS